ncbi:MAG: Cys-tRNA(Pro) deacylase [Ruminococcaceae bacterium]|nr:Cys-tRNA(Pro) deacylase [Oscillospiraceae bacterium]
MAALKTNAMRILDAKRIAYKHYEYDENTTDGLLVAQLLGQPREKVFKTLVTVAASKQNYVFVIPVGETLDLKKAAKTVSEKSLAMIKQKELLPLTGYIHGGCSPVGMKKQFRTVIHSSAKEQETICVSAGHVGNQIEVSVGELSQLIKAEFAEIIV